MKVLHVTQPTTEGVARWVSTLAADQVKRGWSVAVASPTSGFLRDEVINHGAEHHAWHATRSPGPSLLGEMAKLKSVIARAQPDVVHLHSSKAGLAGRLVLRKNVPTIFQPHSWSFNAVGGAMATMSTQWEKAGARWANEIVCVSEAERREGIAIGLDPSVLRTVHNGIDLTAWEPATSSMRRAACRALRVEGDVPTVVCIGRLSNQKGQDRLLDAWAGVVERVPNAQLHLLGDGPMRDVIEARAAQLDGVFVHGTTTTVRDWLAVADVVVIPSRWEGLALSVLEAAASARSLVVSDAAGMAEVVGDQGGAVIAQNHAFVSELAEALVERLSNPELCELEGKAGRARIEEHFDLETALNQTAELTTALSRAQL